MEVTIPYIRILRVILNYCLTQSEIKINYGEETEMEVYIWNPEKSNNVLVELTEELLSYIPAEHQQRLVGLQQRLVGLQQLPAEHQQRLVGLQQLPAEHQQTLAQKKSSISCPFQQLMENNPQKMFKDMRNFRQDLVNEVREQGERIKKIREKIEELLSSTTYEERRRNISNNVTSAGREVERMRTSLEYVLKQLDAKKKSIVVNKEWWNEIEKGLKSVEGLNTKFVWNKSKLEENLVLCEATGRKQYEILQNLIKNDEIAQKEIADMKQALNKSIQKFITPNQNQTLTRPQIPTHLVPIIETKVVEEERNMIVAEKAKGKQKTTDGLGTKRSFPEAFGDRVPMGPAKARSPPMSNQEQRELQNAPKQSRMEQIEKELKEK
ncbi:hypothetical protein L1987_40620 [Smallanthus sonchifolius]|uniref:Uncharacterized protein n=1 Tax=Smallanthus sonchifolius TaxID=185202 RepID=A0ACB9GUJ3_9ASTR|nr:hypothetical protein L1987_40620 [Smallanthus sonchifolius]